ncbi:MAG: restriction endonuclease subunit S [Methanobacteriaceae archaeon]
MRFKDKNNNYFSAWCEKNLGNICEIKKGDQLNKSEMINYGKYYVLNGGVEPSGFTDNWNTYENTITISEGGNSCGYVNYNMHKFWCGGHCYSLQKVSKDIDKKFLYQNLKYNKTKIMKLRVGSGLPNIQKKDLNNFKIFIPELAEQLKISNLLDKLDKKINLNKKDINCLISTKKGLLQQMLV